MNTNTVNTAEGVANEVRARIEQISIAEGFETDIGLKIFEGSIRIAQEDVPAGGCADIIEGVDTVGSRPGRIPNVEISQRFSIIGFHSCDPDHPNRMAHKMIRDMKRVIFARDSASFDDKVIKVEYLAKDIGARADGVDIVMALIEIRVTYVEKLSTP